uniref:Neuropeptide FF receptor 2-like n=1 Tax=Saccoglossus kowalevskii TaxID=10224 RepID=A0ABM0GMT8_SACKO|nr:PREDICTED: neuropeptide FF receptor 2-like [Saccoglossus kowalevskii]
MTEADNMSTTLAPIIDPLQTAEFWELVYALDTPKEVVLIFGILFVILILGGNIWVIVAVIRQPKLRHSATNMFIVSLSLSDILVGLVTVPQHVALWGYFSHLHNDALCKLVAYLQSCSLCATTLSLICIGADRYRAIVQPLRPRMTLQNAMVGCGIVWGVGLIYSIGVFFVVGLNPKLKGSGNDTYIEHTCGVLYEKVEIDAWIRLSDFIIFYIIPLIVLFVLYSVMITTLWFGKSPSNSSNRNKKRAIKMLGFVVLQFAITWAPYHVLQLYYQYVPSLPSKPLIYSTVPVNTVFFIFCCNSWVNPVLYAYFNENFRKEFVRIFPCFYKNARVGPDTTAMSQTSKVDNMSTTRANTQISTISTAT